MKQLFIRSQATTIFFNESTTYNQIVDWVDDLMNNYDSNIFNLNEPHSCSMYKSINETEIFISGDEDSIIISIENVVPINL